MSNIFPAVQYIARRSLMSGVTAGDQVALSLPIRYAGLSRSSSATVQTRTSLTGVRESYFYRNTVSWSIATRPLKPDEALQIIQFLDSAMDGQLIQFSRYSFPTSWINAVLDTQSYSGTPAAERDEYQTFDFAIVEHRET